MRFSLAPPTGSRLRKNALAIFVFTLAAAGAATGFAQFGLTRFVFPQGSTGEALDSRPVWAGGLALGMDTTSTPPDAFTSASYLLPAETIASAAVVSAEAACPEDASCPAKTGKLSRPPRKPQQRQAAAAAAPTPAKRQVVALAAETKPSEAAPLDLKPRDDASKRSGWLNWSTISDRLPKTDTLLKPFSAVSDAVSGLMKRF